VTVQKAELQVASNVILVLLGSVLWQQYQRTLKRWWKNHPGQFFP
jgi:hypothetical protein